MNLLLTGGSGFIGRNIIESYLSTKYNIIAPSSKQLNLLDENSVNSFFADNKIDVVIHSACKPSHRNSKDHTDILYSNTRMFFNLVNNKQNYKKMIVMGSGAVYDMRNYQPKMTEEFMGANIPVDEHGFSRYICSKHIELIDNVVELRIFGIFGKYEDYSIRFISNAIAKAIYDLPITVKQNKKFDYIYINDLMPVLEYFVENDCEHKAYNITPDKSLELLELANIIREVSAKDLDIKIADKTTRMEYSGNNGKLKSEIGNLKFTGMKNAIIELYGWYLANKSSIEKELLLSDK